MDCSHRRGGLFLESQKKNRARGGGKNKMYLEVLRFSSQEDSTSGIWFEIDGKSSFLHTLEDDRKKIKGDSYTIRYLQHHPAHRRRIPR